jgi:hypothetical protein
MNVFNFRLLFKDLFIVICESPLACQRIYPPDILGRLIPPHVSPVRPAILLRTWIAKANVITALLKQCATGIRSCSWKVLDYCITRADDVIYGNASPPNLLVFNDLFFSTLFR